MNPLLLLKPQYLFDPTPGTEFFYFWPVLVLCLAIFAGSLKMKEWIEQQTDPKLTHAFFGGVPARMREFAILGLIWTFFRDQNIPYLGMRVWIVLLAVLALAYGVWTVRHYQKRFTNELGKKVETALEDKYLPRPKKRGRK